MTHGVYFDAVSFCYFDFSVALPTTENLIGTSPFAVVQWYIFSGTVFLLVIVIFIVCLKLYKNKKRYGKFRVIADPIAKLDPKKPMIDQTDKLWYDYQWEFPSKGIHIGKSMALIQISRYMSD